MLGYWDAGISANAGIITNLGIELAADTRGQRQTFYSADLAE